VRGERPDGPLAGAPDGLNVRFLAPGAHWPSAKRNAGWRAASAPLIAFTDDDCRPAPDWLERLLAAADGSGTFVQGRTEPDPDERHLLLGLCHTQEITGPSDWYETCNMAYPRELLERLGGFDEAFRDAGEDTDLALRALEAGARRAFAQDALVRHAVLPRTLIGALHGARRYDSLVRLLSLHPSQREAVKGRLWIKGSHATLVLALLGALLWRRSLVLAVAAAIPYLRGHLAWHLANNPPTPRGLLRLAVHLPAPVAVELAELGYTVRAAVRHRVPVV
jgi:GT2 family glycosyltransferase